MTFLNQKKIFLFLSFLCLSEIILSQNKTELINDIRKEFRSINSDSNYTKVTLDAEDFLDNSPDNGAELTGFYKDGKIKKIRSWIGLSYGIDIKEFYFKNGSLIFVYEKFDSFVYDEKKGEFNYSKTETIYEGRYYFNDKKLINSKITGQKRFDDNDNNPAETLSAEAEENKMLLDKKK
jgi:hypothetical protein